MSEQEYQPGANDVAIIAMAGRFPEAASVEAFWRNLCDGVESIRTFSDEDLAAAGVDRALLEHPAYVKTGTLLADVESFDAAFFNINPREAEIMDPQHRIFLECCWEALERAGCDPAGYDGRVGVFGGAFMSRYAFNLYANPGLLATLGEAAIRWGNDKDYLAPRVSYKLNLRGPSLNINTSCSTSLVAVHVACQSLLNGECDLALAGGVSITSAGPAGYLYNPGDIVSPDGHCRAFDAHAQGTVFGSGAGVVALKRMADALDAGDPIYAVIKGSAINNDGSGKVGFSAPSVDGQTEVIAEALGVAEIDPDTIEYVETHGTGTPLGDPIEIAALTSAFRAGTERTQFCALGAVKTSVGHLGTAAGAAGLIKTALALHHAQIPPTLHFRAPNPNIPFGESPFFVNAALRDWPAGPMPRRAGVSSFGIGGTNAHAVLEEAPPREPSGPSRPSQILPISARTASALDRATDNLRAHLAAHPDESLADVAHTLQVGRRAFEHRRMLVCRDNAGAVAALESADPRRVLSGAPADPSVVFMFPGQGSQYAGMARGLYEAEPTFRATVDRCAELLAPRLGLDLRDLLYPSEGSGIRAQGSASERGDDWQVRPPIPDPRPLALDQTQYAQPALFVIEYALAQLWMEWGVQPEALIGHSIGEYVAATLAGVFELEDALALVAARGKLVQQLAPGSMLVVMLPEEKVRPLLGDRLSLAAVNGPSACVVAGPGDAIDALEQRLAASEVSLRRLHVSHAFHSAMIDPIVETFAEQVAQVALNSPSIPFISNVSGDWISDAEATDPRYWARHLRATVRWNDGIRRLLDAPGRVALEVGPGQTLGALARQQPARADAPLILASLRAARADQPDEDLILHTLGRLWLAGVGVDWAAFAAHERRLRVLLPTYPFERRRYWIDGPGAPRAEAATEGAQPDPQPIAATHPRPNMSAPYADPRSELERGVAEVYRQLLGIGEVGVYDDFFELGGNSILVTQLATQLRARYQVSLPLRDLFDTLTVAGVAEALARARGGDGVGSATAAPLDLRAEAALDPAIRPEARGAAPAAEAERILLTGVTGFLGAFLLNELLDRTSAQIFCLVRAEDEREARRRIRQALEAYQIRRADLGARVVPLIGDLAQLGLGLSGEQFDQLAESLDAIYHNGALVNFITPYHALKPANVEGTREVIRLACQGRAKRLHYVSSIGVLAAPPGQALTFDEGYVSRPQDMRSGYNQSKWVAEQMVRSAGERGLAVSIYRPGNIAGESRSGVCNVSDFLFRAVKGWAQLGIAPDSDSLIDITPVDYVSAALAELSLRPDSAGRTFHLVNPRPARVRTIVDWMLAHGYALDLVAPERWDAELARRLEHAQDNPLYPLLAVFASAAEAAPPRADAAPARAALFDCRNALEGLRDSAIGCPPVDGALLDAYFGYLVRSGFLEAPPIAAR